MIDHLAEDAAAGQQDDLSGGDRRQGVVALDRRLALVAAEIATESPDFGHLEPVFNAALRDLHLAGVIERPEIVVADAGYWHKRQMESIVSDGTKVLIPPDSSLQEQPRVG